MKKQSRKRSLLTLEDRILIDADASAVFDQLTDADDWHRWNLGTSALQLPDGIQDSARGWRVDQRGSRYAVRFNVVELPRRLSMRERRALHTVQRLYTLQPERHTTWINLQIRYGGPTGLLQGLLHHAETRRRMGAALRALKRITEASVRA